MDGYVFVGVIHKNRLVIVGTFKQVHALFQVKYSSGTLQSTSWLLVSETENEPK